MWFVLYGHIIEAQPNIQTSSSFLRTCMKALDMDNYKKLVLVICHLHATTDMPLMVEAENLHIVKWWVDTSFAVHPDMKYHTGEALLFG